MSSYRPKSLDELNSRYDQAMSADIAIKKGVSGIRESEKKAASEPELSENAAEDFSKSTASVKGVEDISSAVDDFIRHLNSEYSPEPFQPSRPHSALPVMPKPVNNTPPVKQPPLRQESTVDDRSGLLDDYMKVMTDQYDEDDEDSSSSVGGYLKKKARKKRKDKTADTQPAAVVPEKSEPMPLPEVNYDDSIYTQAPQAVQTQSDDIYSGSQHESEANESLDSTFSRLDAQSERASKSKKGKGRVALRAVFSLILAGVLVLTAAVASLVLVLKVNTGNLSLDKYYFVTTSADFEEANLKSGDLVICEAGEAVEDKSFVLCVDRNAGSFFFGKKTGGVIDEQGNIMYLVDGQNIYKDNVLGTVKRSFGHIGAVIDFIFRFYIPVLTVLLLLAIALIIVVAVALRNKNKHIEKEAKKGTPGQDADDLRETEKKSKKKSKKKKDDKATQEENPANEENSEDTFFSDYDSFSDI